MTRLTKEEYEQIYAYRRAGASRVEIARRTGRDLALVSRIVSGKYIFRPPVEPQFQRCRDLVESQPGIGRKRAAKELGVSVQRARQLLERVRSQSKQEQQ